MRFLLEDLMHLDIFTGTKVIAGDGKLNNRIGGVCIADRLIQHQGINRDSMVYMPISPVDMDRDEVIDFMDYLKEKGGSVLCFKSWYETAIPEFLTEYAQKLDVPILLLPDNFDFSEAADIFISHIFCKKTKEFIHQNELHLIYNKRYSRYGYKGVLQLWYELSGLPIRSLVNKQRYTLGELDTDSDKDIPDIWRESKPVILYPTAITYDYPIHKSELQESGTYLYSFMTFHKDIEGYVLTASDQPELSDSDTSLMEFTAYWLTLAHKRTHFALFQNLAEQRDFLKELLEGSYSEWVEAAKTAKKLEWELPQELQVITVDYYLEDVVSLLETIRGLSFGIDIQNLIMTDYKRKMVILLPGEPETVKDAAIQIVERLRIKYGLDSFCAGVGVRGGFERIINSYQQSLQAVNIAAILDKDVVSFQDMGVLRLFAPYLDDEEVLSFYGDYYLPIKEFDESHESNLRKTMRVYLDSGCNYSETAKKLFVHYNTVRYRIGLIEKLCSVDMKTQNGLVNMGVALKIAEIMDKQ